MIGYVVSGGFGHCERFLAITEQYTKVSSLPILVHADQLMKTFLEQMTGNITYHWYLQSEKKKRLDYLVKQYQQEFSGCKVLINDLRREFRSLVQQKQQHQLTFSVYHSQLAEDNSQFREWKSSIVNLINDTSNLLFHINVSDPIKPEKLKADYLPIPIISRPISVPPEEVKQALGLSASEKFILVCLGSSMGSYAYSKIKHVYRTLNKIKTPFPLVVMKGMRQKTPALKSHIIAVDMVQNGINLVNAADLVVAKPGMGILQACIATNKPLIFLPGDDSERKLKISLLEKIMGAHSPRVEQICPKAITYGIDQALNHAPLYRERFSATPQGGDLLITQVLTLLTRYDVQDYREILHYVNQWNPYGKHASF